ncbi:MAG: hypothetical protein ACJ731_14540 [Vicinamibacterales bacterium]
MNNEFSWSAAREARIDRAIDRAVREMVQIDPPPGLRRRVLSRLNGSTERRGYLWPARYAAAAIAVATLVIVITMMGARVDAPSPPHAPALAMLAPAPAIQVDPYAPPEPSRSQITRERIRMPRVTNVFGNRPGEVSAAAIDAATQNIVVPPLSIVPLSARPIVLPPLSKGRQ